MKPILTLALALLAGSAFAQQKAHSAAYNKLIPLQGSSYVLAIAENRLKADPAQDPSILFINTSTGEQVAYVFPKGAYIDKIQQLKIDSLNLNKVLISAITHNLNGNKSIDWQDPMQLILIEADGTGKKQLTEDRYYVNTWAVNRHTGVLVVTGFTDTNANGKPDHQDRHEILLYDLKTGVLLKRM